MNNNFSDDISQFQSVVSDLKILSKNITRLYACCWELLLENLLNEITQLRSEVSQGQNTLDNLKKFIWLSFIFSS